MLLKDMLRHNNVMEVETTKTGLTCVVHHSGMLMVKVLYVFGLIIPRVNCAKCTLLFESCHHGCIRQSCIR